MGVLFFQKRGPKILKWMGRGSGQVVNVLAFCSDDPSSNPADTYGFSVKFVFGQNENKQKEAGFSPFFKIRFCNGPGALV